MVTANSTLWQVCDLCYGVDHLSVVGPGFSHDCQYQAGVVKPKKKKTLTGHAADSCSSVIEAVIQEVPFGSVNNGIRWMLH